jgi:tetratricopeptide (TPR) repeat protein/predicted Ser/Thr protein kinase
MGIVWVPVEPRKGSCEVAFTERNAETHRRGELLSGRSLLRLPEGLLMTEARVREPTAGAAQTLPQAPSGSRSDFEDSFLQKVASSQIEHSWIDQPGLQAGDRLGGEDGKRFEIKRSLGAGSMGLVFCAWDSLLERTTAIKLILHRGRRSREELVSLFRREARSAAKLDHENLIRVFDLGTWNDVPFLVMEYLEGESLHALIRRGRLAPERATDILAQVCEGLGHAHEQGIVHRDLKPSNVFVLADGRVKILDFGLARPATASGDPDAFAISGTPPYMAPEQWLGKVQDARTDLWAAGVMFFELLTGRRPFSETDTATLSARVTSPEPAPSPRSECPDCSVEAERIVARALRKDPAERFQTAAEFRAALLSLSDALPAPAKGFGAQLRGRRALAAALALALAAAGATIALFRHRPSPLVAADRPIAVLPFRNLGGGTVQEAFSAGLSETLTNKLRQLERFQGTLRVVSAGEVLKEKVSSAREARDAFGAAMVLAGSVQWTGDRIQVAVDLVDTRNQLVIGARDIELTKEALLELQTLLVQKSADMLEVELRPEAKQALFKDATPVPAAYEFYLKGRGYLLRYDRQENLEEALRMFDEAIAVDPTYSLAHAGRAEVFLRRFQLTKDPKLLVEATRSASRAVELGDKLGPVQLTSGLVHSARGEHAEAIAAFERALAIDDGNADALRELGNAYDAAGRAAEAEATFRRAIARRPGSWAAYKDLGVFLNRHGRLDDAVPAFEKVVSLTPDNYLGYSNLGGIYVRVGRLEDAARALRKSLSLRPNAFAYSSLGYLEYAGGRYPVAADLYAKAAEMSPTDDRLWGALGDSYRFSGRGEESQAPYRKALQLTDQLVAVDAGNVQVRSRRALYSAYLGDDATARTEIEQVLRAAPKDGAVLFRAALIHAVAGRRGDAVQAVRRGLEAGYSVQEIVNAPPLREVRQDPQIAKLIEERTKAARGG